LAKASWDTCLLKNKQGAFLPCLHNAVAILSHHRDWHNVIAFDAFAGVVVKKKLPPWIEHTAPEDESLGDWTRTDSFRTGIWIASEYNCPMPSYIIDEAVQVVADKWKVHPVKDYLSGLRWDKKARIDNLLIRVAGAPDTPYVRAITKCFFLGAVARIMRPGEQVDTVLILEGAQGLGKSTLLRTLASDAWFLDTTFDIGSKDGYQALRRKWLIEFSELDSLGRAELSRVKAFISAVKDTYRQSYGRSATDFFRQCVFAGTVNPNGTGYLNDPTGARRFWPVTLSGKIDQKTVKSERDMLWAEAVARYRKCEEWHLRDPKLLKAAAEEAENRREPHPWETHFNTWLQEHDRTKRGVTIEELLTKAIEMDRDKQGRGPHTEAGKSLRAIGWTVTRQGTDGTRRYFPDPAFSRSISKYTHNQTTENRVLRSYRKRERG
jgi:putative DNA primase/helicase